MPQLSLGGLCDPVADRVKNHMSTPDQQEIRGPATVVLVIEHESHTRRFISDGLERYGYSVREAEDGAAALSAVAQIQPDVIILDLSLPDVSGIEALETIRQSSSAPIIVLSAKAGDEQKAHLLKIGADDYMDKPFGISELFARCEAALRIRRKPAG